MALFSPDDFGLPDRNTNTSVIVGDQGIPVAQTDSKKQVTRQGAAAAEADYDINSYNLSDSDWLITDRVEENYPPDTGGVDVCVVYVESEDNNQFELEITPHKLDGDGNPVQLGTIDKNVSPRLESTENAPKNHHIYESFEVMSDRVAVRITNTNSPAQNNITGSLNFH